DMDLRWDYFIYQFLILIFIFSISPLHAQRNIISFPVNTLPEANFIYYSDYLAYINPAGVRLQSQYSINAKVGSYSGIRKNISEYYLDVWWQPKDTTRLAFGLQFYNNNQGEFIHFTQAKWITRYSIYLNKDIRVIPAVGIGLMNYAFEGNSYSAGGSSIVPDLDLGVSLQSKKWNIGISALHLIDKKLQPMSATFDKNNLLNFYLSRVSYLGSSDYTLKYMFVTSYNRKTHNLHHDLTMELVHRNTIKAIILLYHGKVLGMGVGMQELDTPLGRVGMNFIYSVAVSGRYLTQTNRYEIGISYRFGKKVT
ncbi:MAG TPA: type IX secretion system membrane protein PorP/SprF, partial [Cytophagaceae bacterium]